MAGQSAFAEALASEIGDGDITLDLSDLSFIDSSGIQALIQAADKLDNRGRLILRAPGKTVMRVFELVRLETAPNIEIRPGDTPQSETS